MIGLICYRGNWYRVLRTTDLSPRIMSLLDTVALIDGTSYKVVKNRYGGTTGQAFSLNLLAMQLFIKGMTLDDLPEFKHRAAQGDVQGGLIELKVGSDGNLVTSQIKPNINWVVNNY